MKLLTPMIYAIVASAAIPSAFAVEDYKAYRLGNYNSALQSLNNSKDKDGVADYYLGRLYLYGYGQLKNNSVALRYFDQSASKGYLPAQQLLARYALLREKNPEKAFTWFKKAAASGDINAKVYVAGAYLFGVGVKQNKEMARQFYIEAAKNGDPLAQYTLADHFLDSRQAANKKLGLIWLNKAVNAGNPRAQLRLAKLYFKGQLVTKDLQIAQELTDKALKQNYTPALVFLGDIALENKDYPGAKNNYEKAIALGNKTAEFKLANLYLIENTPLYNKDSAYLSMLRAAQAGYVPAQKGLAVFYEKGIGVTPDPNLVKQWQAKAESTKKNHNNGLYSLSKWVTNGVSDSIEKTDYQLGGIFTAWNNPSALNENNYNAPPLRESISKQTLFKPDFTIIQPNEVPISSYYDALVNAYSQNTDKPKWNFPYYKLNTEIASLRRANSLILDHKDQILPYRDEYPLKDQTVEVIDFLVPKRDDVLSFNSLVARLQNRAIVGDGEAQFDLGQLYEHGIGVPKDEDLAIFMYQNAVDQQHEGAEYTLGMLYFKRGTREDEQKGLDNLLSAAFKGNAFSQYALGKIYSINKDPKFADFYSSQALSLQYIAAANGYAPAQFELAETLARQKGGDMSVASQNHRIHTIRTLYARAAAQGYSEALLPLAFYNAMDPDKNLQNEAFKVASEQALAGNKNAALLTGLLYDRGIGVTADPAQALSWYQKAGDNAVRDFILGSYMSEGKGIVLDKERGKTMLQQAAAAQFPYAFFNIAIIDQKMNADFLPNLKKAYELGNSKAGILLADYYLASEENAEAMEQAKAIYQGLAAKGDQFAQLKLGFMFAKGLGNQANLLEAQQWYTMAANQGNPEAQYLLAELYQTGIEAAPDYPAAIAWYEKSAQKLPKAWVALGFLYETVFDDYPKALDAYIKAADKGDAYGQYDLALMYENAKGVPQDYAKAMGYYKSAADQGLIQAMPQLAGLYFHIQKDPNTTLFWYKKAADRGNDVALYQLGLLSETGVGTKISLSDAQNYYRQSVDKGNEKAMLALARMYNYGLGVPQNKAAATKYYELLADKNVPYAQVQLAKQYLSENSREDLTEKGKVLLEKASANGSREAGILLQRMKAKSGGNVSYIEPVTLNRVSKIDYPTPDQFYLGALSAWTQGDEVLSRSMLSALLHKYPNYSPAKEAYEELKG